MARSKTSLPPDPRLDAKKAEILALVDDFASTYLNAEYKRIIHKLVAQIAKETPSPLLRGRTDIWAAGVVYAIGAANYLFDKSFKPYISAADLAVAFGVAVGSASQKAGQLRDRYPIDFPNTDFATKRMREMAGKMGGMFGQGGWFFDDENVSITMQNTDGSFAQTDSFLFAPRTPRKGEFIDDDHDVMGDFHELMMADEKPGQEAQTIKALEKLITADPDFFDTYLTLAEYVEEDDEARAVTLRETAFGRALARVTDGKGDLPESLPWGYLENRHIIRALIRGAIDFWEAGDTESALGFLRGLLRSNPHDNIGARYYIAAIRLGETLEQHEARFETENGYMDALKMMDWFDHESARFPDEFALWRKAVGE